VRLKLPRLSPRTRRRITDFDNAVEVQVARLRGNPVTDRVFYTASSLGEHGTIWLMLGALRGLRSEHDWKAAVRVGVGVGIESAVVNLGVKSIFRRTRPVPTFAHPLPFRHPRTSSFPSGHATSAFTAAALLSEGDPLWPLYYAAATVVATSRVYVKIHHASDVVGGIAMGMVMGRIGRRLFPLAPPTAGMPESQGGLHRS
jgi:membrane-associated phospholipid phosphatase